METKILIGTKAEDGRNIIISFPEKGTMSEVVIPAIGDEIAVSPTMSKPVVVKRRVFKFRPGPTLEVWLNSDPEWPEA